MTRLLFSDLNHSSVPRQLAAAYERFDPFVSRREEEAKEGDKLRRERERDEERAKKAIIRGGGTPLQMNTTSSPAVGRIASKYLYNTGGGVGSDRMRMVIFIRMCMRICARVCNCVCMNT